MKTAICKHCGKEGILTSFPYRGSTMTILKHYCPVKAAKRQAEKKAALEKAVEQVLKEGVDNCWQGWFFPAQGILFKRYPHKTVDIIDEVFHGVELTEDEKLQQKAFDEARMRYQKEVYGYIQKYRRFPTAKRYLMIAEKV